MALQEGTVNETFGSVVNFGFDFRVNLRADSETMSVPTSAIHEVHPFAAMVGILADHPLRNEFLEILGVGIEDPF